MSTTTTTTGETFTSEQLEAIRQQLIATAEREHAAHDQYAGYWNGWELAEVVRPIDDKWGDRMADPGLFVLVEPATRFPHLSASPGYATAYLDAATHWRKRLPKGAAGENMGCNTSVPASSLRRIELKAVTS